MSDYTLKVDGYEIPLESIEIKCQPGESVLLTGKQEKAESITISAETARGVHINLNTE